MDLLEYQAKELFRQVGIPVLPSQCIARLQDLKGLAIPYPIVLKSQVPIGGRRRAGGIRFVENTIDAVAAAQTIFNLPIFGKYPELLLAEAKYDTEKEFYLAIVLDYAARCPVLLGSQKGEGDVRLRVENIQQVVVDQDFSPFYARRLALKMGLQGELIGTIGGIVEKMYCLFSRWDLDLVEITPLGIRADREVMALDGKVTINDRALGRQVNSAFPFVQSLKDFRYQGKKTGLNLLKGIEPDGKIGLVCNGIGLMVATADLIYQQGGRPACCLNLSEDNDIKFQNGDLNGIDPVVVGSTHSINDAFGADVSRTDVSRTDVSRTDVSRTDVSQIDASQIDASQIDASQIDVSQADVLQNGSFHAEWQSHVFCDRLRQGFDRTLENRNIKAILINILGSIVPCDRIALAIADYLKQHSYQFSHSSKSNGSMLRSVTRQPMTRAIVRQAAMTSRSHSVDFQQSHPIRPDRLSTATQPSSSLNDFPPVVVRLVGENVELAKQHLAVLNIPLLESLDEAVARVVALAKSAPSS